MRSCLTSFSNNWMRFILYLMSCCVCIRSVSICLKSCRTIFFRMFAGDSSDRSRSILCAAIIDMYGSDSFCKDSRAPRICTGNRSFWATTLTSLKRQFTNRTYTGKPVFDVLPAQHHVRVFTHFNTYVVNTRYNGLSVRSFFFPSLVIRLWF